MYAGVIKTFFNTFSLLTSSLYSCLRVTIAAWWSGEKNKEILKMLYSFSRKRKP